MSEIRELSRQIVTKIARDTASILHTRNSLGIAEDFFESIDVAAFCNEAEALATGEECGCLEPDEAIENSLMVWTERILSQRVQELEEQLKDMETIEDSQHRAVMQNEELRDRVQGLEDALRGVMALIESRQLVRDISGDGESGWAMKQVGLVQTLAKARRALEGSK